MNQRRTDLAIAPTSFLWNAYYPNRYYYEVRSIGSPAMIDGAPWWFALPGLELNSHYLRLTLRPFCFFPLAAFFLVIVVVVLVLYACGVCLVLLPSTQPRKPAGCPIKHDFSLTPFRVIPCICVCVCVRVLRRCSSACGVCC